MKKELENEIKTILLNDWDPIGIKDISEAHNEYDMYVSEIVNCLIDRKGVDSIIEFLVWAESVRMGLDVNFDRTRKVAHKILSLL